MIWRETSLLIRVPRFHKPQIIIIQNRKLDFREGGFLERTKDIRNKRRSTDLCTTKRLKYFSFTFWYSSFSKFHSSLFFRICNSIFTLTIFCQNVGKRASLRKIVIARRMRTVEWSMRRIHVAPPQRTTKKQKLEKLPPFLIDGSKCD